MLDGMDEKPFPLGGLPRGQGYGDIGGRAYASRTSLYPQISSIFMRLACHRWVSSQTLSPAVALI